MIEVRILNPDFEKAILTLDDKTLELFVNKSSKRSRVELLGSVKIKTIKDGKLYELDVKTYQGGYVVVQDFGPELLPQVNEFVAELQKAIDNSKA